MTDVRPPYRPPDLSWLAGEGSPLPDGFLWGAAVAGKQVEGGLGAPGEPEDQWAAWERSGRVEPSGEGVRFWIEPEPLLDLAAGLGLTALRTSVEWSRLQPASGAGLDRDAVGRYAAIVAGCRARGLEPVLTLHHFTQPAWLGTDPWLEAWMPEAFERYAEKAARNLGRALAERGEAPVRWWLTVNEPNILALLTYVFPGHPRGAGLSVARFRRAQDLIMAAHVRGYRAVHRAYTEEGWPAPMVSFNTYARSGYHQDLGLFELGAARAAGVPRHALRDHLAVERSRFESEIAGLAGPTSMRVEALVGRILLPDLASSLPTYVDRLYAGDGPAHDYLALDHYVPPLSDYARMPSARTWRERTIPVGAELWETTIRPQGLRMFLRAYHRPDRPLPILVAENGMATRVRGGLRRDRADGWRRPAFLRAHVGELLQAAREGVPVAGYLHWSLVDNWEWGSYEPRFGLFGVDRRGAVSIMDTDAAGDDSGGTYREIVESLRESDGPRALAALV
ncbi:MAG: glycoside hydrolase family 1 protein [Actinobacteria bacterium]|nr:glycoside hydrolase family 1 protein [Actinomycetota bacterium]